MNSPDLQQILFDAIKNTFFNGEKLSDVIQTDLNISSDAAYRRIRGDVPLTIYETKILTEKYRLSFDNIGEFQKDKVIFDYKPLSDIEFNFAGYLTSLRDTLRQVKLKDNPHLYISVKDTPILQLFNFPHLTRFKFFFWAKSFLRIEDYKDTKFAYEKIDPKVLAIGIETHNLYNSMPTSELYSPETLQGTLRQIEYYFDSDLFEDTNYVIVLLDNLLELSSHLQKQAEIGHKFVYGNEPNTAEATKINMYYNATYLPDNTYYIEYEDSGHTIFTHNIMNTIRTADPVYNKDTKMILDRLMDNSTLISVTASKERNKFFSSLNKKIINFKKRIQLELEIED
jgi:hypothetical protein